MTWITALTWITIFGSFYYLHEYRKKLITKRNDAWNGAAIQLGFNFTPKKNALRYIFQPYNMQGSINGYPCSIFTFTKTTGPKGQQTAFIKYELNFPVPFDMGLNLKKNGVLQGSDTIKTKDFLTPAKAKSLLQTTLYLKNVKGKNHIIERILFPPRLYLTDESLYLIRILGLKELPESTEIVDSMSQIIDLSDILLS
jgi:hypothetical protein